MKYLCLILLLSISAQVFAKNISNTSVGRYASYEGLFHSQTAKMEHKLAKYLDDSAGCTDVKLCTYFIDRKEYNQLTEYSSDSWLNGIQYDYYKTIMLTQCPTTVSMMKFKSFYAMDWGQHTDFRISFVKNGQTINEELRVGIESYPNTGGEVRHSQTGCPNL